MPSEFVNGVTKHNLTTWYLLPLIHLNKISFGQGNFIESYVNSKGSMLTVEVISVSMCHDDCFKHRNYWGHREVSEQFSMIYYYLPKKWKNDFDLFVLGRFSALSGEAKRRIREYSGLMYEQWNGRTYSTDALLHALDKSPILREAWEQELDLQPLPEDLELMPIPPERTYREYPIL